MILRRPDAEPRGEDAGSGSAAWTSGLPWWRECRDGRSEGSKVRGRADGRWHAVVEGEELGRLPLAAGAEAAADAHLGTAAGRPLHI